MLWAVHVQWCIFGVSCLAWPKLFVQGTGKQQHILCRACRRTASQIALQFAAGFGWFPAADLSSHMDTRIPHAVVCCRKQRLVLCFYLGQGFNRFVCAESGSNSQQQLCHSAHCHLESVCVCFMCVIPCSIGLPASHAQRCIDTTTFKPRGLHETACFRGPHHGSQNALMFLFVSGCSR